MRAIGFAMFLIAAACTSSQKGTESAPEVESSQPPTGEATAAEPAAAQPAQEPAEATAEVGNDSGGTPPAASDLPTDSVGEDSASGDCVAKCVEANQMRAVAPEAIEKDCATQCDAK